MKITLLVDQLEHETLQSEFGLALLLEDAAGNFLFDTFFTLCDALVADNQKLQCARKNAYFYYYVDFGRVVLDGIGAYDSWTSACRA